MEKRRNKAYGVSVYVFGDRVDYYVCAMIQRILNIWAQEGIVDNDHDPMAMRHCCHFSDINQAQRRVTGAFDPDEFGLIRSNELGDINFNTRGESDLNAMSSSHFGEVAMRAAVDIGDGNDVRALCEGLKNESRSCRTG